jgi:hypothetical protein
MIWGQVLTAAFGFGSPNTIEETRIAAGARRIVFRKVLLSISASWKNGRDMLAPYDWRDQAFTYFTNPALIVGLGHGRDDVEHQASGWGAEVEVVPQGDESDAKDFEVSNGIHEVLQRPSEPVQLPAAHRIEFPMVCVRHQPVQRWPGILRPADAVVKMVLAPATT